MRSHRLGEDTVLQDLLLDECVHLDNPYRRVTKENIQISFFFFALSTLTSTHVEMQDFMVIQNV